MGALFEKGSKQPPISVLFPNMPAEEQRAVEETLDAYCELLLRIFERLENQRLRNFDDLSARP
jgi:hypothetical protein